ncbi:uncharacterized protein LOC120008666 [Tripterygium wilfordii]|uniref:uncharacterized protein LOC120008666 n=1 Tax=Tripterygium wilfordii TaxID=458696 RepID=UPI0018F847C1|nr:uncharacterized protein LOC120008666 [Tripterygium wilfordii]
MEIPIYINVSIALVFITLTCIWNPTFSMKSCDFPAIFNLGDSNSDTGGLAASLVTPTPPYGETFFHMPVGRFSDGRLIIDFIAKSFDLPYLDAYLDSLGTNFSHGANFATANSTIGLPTTIIPVRHGFSPFYLTKQYDQFIQFKRRSQMIRKKGEKTFASLMPKEEYFSKALYTFDIGQNDLAEGFLGNMSIAEVNASVPGIVDEFVKTVKNIYMSGGRSFWIHNTGPIGCLPYILTNFLSAERDNVGCAKPHNEVSQYFNHKLREAVFQLRNDFPDGAFTYVDIYSAKYSFFKEPKRYGKQSMLLLILHFFIVFLSGFQLPLVACCGYGGKYNYSNSVDCGGTITINGTQIFVGSCEHPNARVNWDGVHYTEVAAKYVFDQISTGNFSDPPIPLKMACHRTIDIEIMMELGVKTSAVVGDPLPYLNTYLFILFLTLICIWHPISSLESCPFPADNIEESCDFPAIFNFGDSNSDTGASAATGVFPPPTPPYGDTFFQMPSGRYCDGRFIIDFIAQSFGLPYLNPYLDSLGTNFSHGANFAVAGATIRDFPTSPVPFYLTIQYRQFEQFKLRSQIIRQKGGVFASMMPKEEYFSKALYTFDIGHNDIGGPLAVTNMSIQQINESIPDAINEFITNVKNTYNLGGRSFWIHNVGPTGCLPPYLEKFFSAEVDNVGCAKPYNGLVQYFNDKLKESILQLRKDFQDAAITYVDAYSVKYALHSEPKKYGFEHPLVACCGYGGRYNFGAGLTCGRTITVNGTEIFIGSCEHPKVRVVWDGGHYTEAANKFIFDQISSGAYSDPPIPLRVACHKTLVTHIEGMCYVGNHYFH